MKTTDDSWYEQLNPLQDTADRPDGARRPMYLLHKYWARKPWYFVRQCIEHYTRAGDTVLDPFCGSGVTLAEGLAAGRRVVGVDLNPAAVLLSRLTAAGPVSLAEFDQLVERVAQRAQARITALYELDEMCPRCGQRLWARWVGRGPTWLADGGAQVRYECPAGCLPGDNQRRLSEGELGRLARSEASDEARAALEWLAAYPLRYPDGRRFDKKRRQETLADLFSARNLLALSILRDAIEAEAGPPPGRVDSGTTGSLSGELLWLTFTSASHLCSRFRAPRAGHWAINGLYIPPDWVDENVWIKWRDRVARTREAKRESNRRIGATYSGSSCSVIGGSAARLGQLVTPGADYVFTDPPYGDSIQYFELSYLWNCLLEFPVDHRDEIIVNRFQDKDLAAYQSLLTTSFGEIHRALRPGRWMTVTFANKNSRVWNTLLAACAQAGFELVNITTLNPISRAYNQIWAKPAPKTDLVINFWRPSESAHKQRQATPTLDLVATVERAATRLIAERGAVTTGQVSEEVLKQWITRTYGAALAGGQQRIDFTTADVEQILARRFVRASRPERGSAAGATGRGVYEQAWIGADDAPAGSRK